MLQNDVNSKNQSKLKDDRIGYLLVMLFMINVGLALGLVLNSQDFYYYDIFTWSSFYNHFLEMNIGHWAVSLFMLCASAFTVRLYILKKTWSKRIGYGIPLILFGPAPFLFLYAYSCTGKFCGILEMVLATILVVAGLILTFFYNVVTNFRNWSFGTIRLAVILSAIFMLSAMGYVGYLAVRDYPIAQYLNNKENDLNKVAAFCDNHSSSLVDDCWEVLINKNPNYNVCSLVVNESSQSKCYRELLYIIHYRCDGKSGDCWVGVANKYPEIDVCKFLYDSDKEECNESIHPIKK